ncbi:MAG: hypothetical protein ACI39R_00070 [Lachnospiraceae bacterium]
MRKIVLDMQSGLYAKALQRILVQELYDYQVIISEMPDKTVQRCKICEPYALLMEVTGYTPWILEERLAIRDEVKKNNPDCKIVILVDDNADKVLANKVKNAKINGQIDAFLFGSVTDSYLAAMMDSL